MKSFKIFAGSLVAMVLLTGCGTKTLTCTKTEEDSGLSMKEEVTMKFKNNKVNYVKMSIDSTATDDDIKDNWGLFVSFLGSAYEEKDEDGIKISVKNDEENYAYKVSIEVDLEKAGEKALAEYDLDGIADSNSKLEDVKKEAEEDGFTCK